MLRDRLDKSFYLIDQCNELTRTYLIKNLGSSAVRYAIEIKNRVFNQSV